MKKSNLSHRKQIGIVWATVCAVISLLFAFPFYILLTASFKTVQELNQVPPTYFPKVFSVESFQRLGKVGNGIWIHVTNSLILALITVVGTVLISTLAGWGFARYPFRGRGILFILILAAIMIPFQPLLIPLFLVLKTIGLSSSLLGVGLIYVAFQMPFSVFVMRNAFLDVPRALEDAGRVDGANGLKLFTNVLFPLVRPGIITVAMFAFFSSWNEYMAAMVLLQSQDSFPLPVVLQTAIVTGLTGVDWSLLQAGVLATMLPCLLLFFVLQRFYISGIVAGAVKD